MEAVAGREIRAAQAVWGFAILGPDGRSAIPELVRVAHGVREESAFSAITALGYLGKDALPPLFILATNRSFRLRSNVAMSAIGQMHYLGTNAHPAVLFLIESLKKPQLDVWAADILGRLGLEPDLSIPALAECLRSPNRGLRIMALYSLEKFGGSAKGAVPTLLKTIDDPEVKVRMEATNALEKIAPEVLKQTSP
jgi:HEAT repeat protein